MCIICVLDRVRKASESTEDEMPNEYRLRIEAIENEFGPTGSAGAAVLAGAVHSFSGGKAEAVMNSLDLYASELRAARAREVERDQQELVPVTVVHEGKPVKMLAQQENGEIGLSDGYLETYGESYSVVTLLSGSRVAYKTSDLRAVA